VTEEVTGIDLVREMFRIADGEHLGYDDPPLRGHSFEFRINGEDPGRGFLPAPGTVTTFTAPTGPGVRLDAGVESGSVIGPAWDSLLAKLVITGATRQQALQRAARALAEFTVEGMATAIPFHRVVVTDPAFAPELTGSSDPFTVHTRWIETEFTNDIKPFAAPADTDTDDDGDRETIVVEVGGKRLEVSLPAALGMTLARTGLAAGAKPKRRAAKKSGPAASGDTLASPMQGTIVKVAVEEGQEVKEGDLVVVLEAMKMEQPLNAHRSGTIKGRAADYAGLLGCSVRTLSRAARDATGKGVREVIDERRLLEARRLLGGAGWDARAVAVHLGFTDPANFGRFFRNHTGLTPTDFTAREADTDM
ncbi:helix-turn-helix domain-containing protein, partial [Streptomyces caniscabiei]